MGMELQLRQSNLGPHSSQYAELNRVTTLGKVKGIVGVYSIRKLRQDRKWFVKIPDFKAPEGAYSFHCPVLNLVDEGKQESKDYMLDPTHPCLADVRPDHIQQYRDVEQSAHMVDLVLP